MSNWYSNPHVLGPALAALIGIGVGYLGSRAEDRKADAEFARLALSILSVEEGKQNPSARRIAMRMLAETLPVELSEDEQEEWLNEKPVFFNAVNWTDVWLSDPKKFEGVENLENLLRRLEEKDLMLTPSIDNNNERTEPN